MVQFRKSLAMLLFKFYGNRVLDASMNILDIISTRRSFILSSFDVTEKVSENSRRVPQLFLGLRIG